MADPFRDTDPAERTGLPRWAKVVGITVAVLALLIVIMMAAGGGSGHNPPSHSSGGGDGGTTPAASQSAIPASHTPLPGSHG